MTPEDSLIIIPAAWGTDTLDARLDTTLMNARAAEPADTATAITVAAEPLPPAWMDGLEPSDRVTQPGRNSGFLMVLALLIVILTYNFRHLSRHTRNYFEELVKVRDGRDNVFDERPAGDTRVLILIIVLAIVSGGILIASAVTDRPPMTGKTLAVCTGLAAAYYAVLLGAYHLVGYTFTTPPRHHDWVRSFNASTALAGLGMAVPSILALFYPALAPTVVLIGCFVYFAFHLLFIYKGFRIFYTNFGSLLYFILYLCTLEIIPVIFVYKAAT